MWYVVCGPVFDCGCLDVVCAWWRCQWNHSTDKPIIINHIRNFNTNKSWTFNFGNYLANKREMLRSVYVNMYVYIFLHVAATTSTSDCKTNESTRDWVRQKKHEKNFDNVAFVCVKPWNGQSIVCNVRQLFRGQQERENICGNLAQVKLHISWRDNTIAFYSVACRIFFLLSLGYYFPFSSLHFCILFYFLPKIIIFLRGKNAHVRHNDKCHRGRKQLYETETFATLSVFSRDGRPVAPETHGVNVRVRWGRERGWRSAARWNGKWDEKESCKLAENKMRIIHMLEIYLYRIVFTLHAAWSTLWHTWESHRNAIDRKRACRVIVGE